MEATLENLKEVSRQYEVNFKLLVASVNTPSQTEYLKEEHRLNRLNIQLQSDLGIYIDDPCKLSSNGADCDKCSGWIKRVRGGDNKLKRGLVLKVPAQPNEPGAWKCFLRQFSLKNSRNTWINKLAL